MGAGVELSPALRPTSMIGVPSLPGMHFQEVAVISQCSAGSQSPRQGISSHNPVAGLQVVPVGQAA